MEEEQMKNITREDDTNRYYVCVKDQRTGAKKIVDTAPDAYSADRKAIRIWRTLDADHVAYFEPVQGWAAETARAAVIAGEWESWRKANGF